VFPTCFLPASLSDLSLQASPLDTCFLDDIQKEIEARFSGVWCGLKMPSELGNERERYNAEGHSMMESPSL